MTVTVGVPTDDRDLWVGAIGLDREEVLERVFLDGRDAPDRNMAELAFDRSFGGKPFCPAGLLDESAIEAIRIDGHVDRMKSPPFAGGALDQPQPLLDAMAIVSGRRALNQHRLRKTIPGAG